MSDKKLQILFDAYPLRYGSSKIASRSGIYFTVFNILKELLERNDVETSIVCNDKTIYTILKEELEKSYPDKNINIETYLDNNELYEKVNKLAEDKKQAKKDKKPFRRLFIQFKLLLFSLRIKFEKMQSTERRLRKYDAYFSSAHAVPKKILKNKHLKRYSILYDAIPLLYAKLHRDSQKGSWFYDLFNSLNGNDYYFTISDYTKKDFIKNCPKLDANKMFTTLLACSEDFKKEDIEKIEYSKKKYNIPNDKKYIFSLCTLEPRKNLIRAVKTFIQFIDKNNINDLVFVLGGGHWVEFIEKIESEIENLGKYKDKIIKAGYIDDEDLSSLYSGAEWFTYTSIYEGFGLPPLEAMSCGCPVIASNTSSLPEVVGDAAITINPESDTEHIEAYEKYYFNQNLRAENSSKGLIQAGKFSWKNCCDNMIDHIKETIK